MKKSFAKLTAAIGPALLSMLGFSGCEDNIWSNRCEYGVPSCDFKVDLTVLDESGKGIKGIRVVPSKQLTYDKDTLFTDKNGKAVGAYDGVWPMNEVKFYFDDVDGDANGYFKRDSLTVTAEKLKGGSGNWYKGEFALKGTKTLKKSE